MTATVTSATYANGTLEIVFGGLAANDPIKLDHITVTGQDGGTYTLTSPNQTLNSNTAINFPVSAADALNLNRLFNKQGLTANDVGNTAFNIALADGFVSGKEAQSPPIAQVPVNVSSYSKPSITSATYDAAASVLTITGANLINTVGSGPNDISAGKFTLTGQGGSYTLHTSADVEVTSATSFTVTLGGADIAGVNALLDRNGTSSSGHATYGLTAADGWDGTVAGGNAITTAAPITAQGGTPATTVSSVTFGTTSAGDTGAFNNDFITNVATQAPIRINLSAVLVSTEVVEVQLDNGGAWLAATLFTGTGSTGREWNFRAAADVTPNSTVLLSGTHVLGVRVRDTASGLSATPFTQTYTLDTTAPAFSSATVSGNTLVMTYGEALDAVHAPANSTFNVLVGGLADAVTGVAVDSAAKTVTLTLTTAVTSGQVVTLGYTDPANDNPNGVIQDVAGNDAATLTAQAVTNATAAPVVDSGPATVPGITASAPAGGGTVQGGAGNDTLSATSGTNTFIAAGGSDTITGGSGRDTVVIAGTRAGYTLVHNTDGSFTLQSVSDPGTTVRMTGVERVTFNNQTLALDVTPQAAQIDGLYKLALGRDPEDAGLGYYVAAGVQGASLMQMAAGFAASPEFAKNYGGLSDTAFITQLYANAFGRAPDAGGLAFYQDQLSHLGGLAGRAALLVDFVASPEMQVKLAGLADQGIPLLG